jgi:hypothetical protein
VRVECAVHACCRAVTFSDKASGKDTRRPQLDTLLSFVREGDTVVAHSTDRLARNLDDLRRLVRDMTKRGARIEFLKGNLTVTGEDSPMANLMLSLMGAFAEVDLDPVFCHGVVSDQLTGSSTDGRKESKVMELGPPVEVRGVAELLFLNPSQSTPIWYPRLTSLH